MATEGMFEQGMKGEGERALSEKNLIARVLSQWLKLHMDYGCRL
jgi:hypothetical protein